MRTMLFYGKCGLVVLALGMFGFVSTGCQAVEGAGRDMQAAGAGVEDVAEDVRPYEGRPR